MLSIGAKNPHCKQCGYELNGGESVCPKCQFSPRQRGLRVSLGLLMGVVICMSIVMVLPAIGPLLVRFAALAFVLSFVMLLVSFLATPYRLGSLFLRL